MSNYECPSCGNAWPCPCTISAKEEAEARRSAAACSGVESRVAADIAARQRLGILKYGTTVESNPLPLRDWLEHAYQESLDLPIYLKRAIEEIDSQNGEAVVPGGAE